MRVRQERRMSVRPYRRKENGTMKENDIAREKY